MKIKGEAFEKMRSDVLTLVDKKWGRSVVKRFYNNAPKRTAHDVWFAVCQERTQTNDHPRFKNGAVRYLEYDPNFDIYPCGSSDSHVFTAMRKILNSL